MHAQTKEAHYSIAVMSLNNNIENTDCNFERSSGLFNMYFLSDITSIKYYEKQFDSHSGKRHHIYII